MDDYFKQFREMISLRGLTDHTIVSYSTYIRVYLDYLSYILHKMPEDVSWAELRGFVRWLQKEKISRTGPSITVFPSFVSLPFMSFTNPGTPLSSRCAGLIPISPMSLHRKKPGLLFILFPTSSTKQSFRSCIPPGFALVKSARSDMRTSAAPPCASTSVIPKRVLTGMRSSPGMPWISSLNTGSMPAGQRGSSSPTGRIPHGPWLLIP